MHLFVNVIIRFTRLFIVNCWLVQFLFSNFSSAKGDQVSACGLDLACRTVSFVLWVLIFGNIKSDGSVNWCVSPSCSNQCCLQLSCCQISGPTGSCMGQIKSVEMSPNLWGNLQSQIFGGGMNMAPGAMEMKASLPNSSPQTKWCGLLLWIQSTDQPCSTHRALGTEWVVIPLLCAIQFLLKYL